MVEMKKRKQAFLGEMRVDIHRNRYRKGGIISLSKLSKI